MTATVDATLMPLGQAEEAFEVEIVPWPVGDVVADEEARLEGLHGLGHGLAKRQGGAVESLLECAE